MHRWLSSSGFILERRGGKTDHREGLGKKLCVIACFLIIWSQGGTKRFSGGGGLCT